MFRNVTFKIAIFLGSDGQTLDVCMSNHSNEHNVSVESTMLFGNIDDSNETLQNVCKKHVKQYCSDGLGLVRL